MALPCFVSKVTFDLVMLCATTRCTSLFASNALCVDLLITTNRECSEVASHYFTRVVFCSRHLMNVYKEVTQIVSLKNSGSKSHSSVAMLLSAGKCAKDLDLQAYTQAHMAGTNNPVPVARSNWEYC